MVAQHDVLRLVMLVVSLLIVVTVTLSVSAIINAVPFLASLTVVPIGATLLGALSLASVAEIYLVLLAIKEDSRASAAAAHATAQALQKQAEMVATLATVAQNTRFAADDLLKMGKLLEQVADEQRRGLAVLPGLATQAQSLAEQSRQDGTRLATIEAIARAFAQRWLSPPTGGGPHP
jgi:hypothetical protein